MTQSKISPRRSWGRIALVAVLVLSLFGNAIAVGAWLRLREMRSALLGPDGSAAVFPAELRQDLRGALRAESHRLMPLLQNVVRARTDVVKAATAQPHNRAATAAAMETLRREVDALLAAAQLVALDHLDARTTPSD